MKLMATMILATWVLFECGPKQYSRFTLDHPAKLSGQLLDPQGAAVSNLKLVVKCGSAKYARVTDLEGKYDFGILPAGNCEIGTTEEIWRSPEVTCDAEGCAIQKLRLSPMSVTVT
jgi:hypothetical protein